MAEKKFFQRIKGKDVEYMIYPEERRVVCRLLDCSRTAFKRILKYTNADYVIGPYRVDDTFVGIAKCAPEDEFDAEFGMKLALARAKRKRGKAVNHKVQQYIDDVQYSLDKLRAYAIHPELEIRFKEPEAEDNSERERI